MTRLDEIRQRAERATPGPWYPGYMDRVVTNRRGDGSDSICHIYEEGQPANQAFIAHAREDIPYLLELVERMRECLGSVLDYSIPRAESHRHKDVLAEARREGYELLTELDQR